ncbi:MAG: fatty acid desaturase, partial [Hyphomicrobiaceae bacterium]
TIAPLKWLAWNMQYHTAHHAFPSVPFHKLKDLHREIVANTGREPHTMGYLEFQREVFRKFSSGKTESDYPEMEAWVVSKHEKLDEADPAPDAVQA